MKTAIIKTDFWKDDKIPDLNSDTKLLYLCLLTNPDRNTSPAFKCSDRMLSAYTGYNKDLINICRNQLIEKKLIIYINGYYILNHQDYVEPKKGKLTKVILDKYLDELPENIRVKAQEMLKSGSRGTLEYIYKDKDIYNNKDINKNKNYEQNFEKFYSEYPNKKSKQKAREKFIKLKVDGELMEMIMSALRKQKNTEQWLKDNGKFIPHPTTWLNQARWEDEVEDVNDFIKNNTVAF